MGSDGDDPISLPSPPPPRPAARRDAIDAAMRRFDGVEEPAAPREPRRLIWSTIHRRPAGALIAAALIAVIAIPAIQLGLPDPPEDVASEEAQDTAGIQPAPTAPAPVPIAEAPRPAAEQPQPAADQALADATPPSAQSPEAPAVAARQRSAIALSPDAQKVSQDAPAPMAPPPPAPPPAAERQAEAAASGDVVVTGSRISRPQLESAAPVTIVEDAYGAFLSRLQSAVRANDKRAVVNLVGLPLRVNFDGGPQIYRDRRSIQRDFDRIFTPRVRQAILNQRANRLFVNYQGAMIGDGEVWFDHSCPDASCAPAGRVSIKTINP